ncbi:MAG: MarR family transcriptional regulator [Colwellia sp.]
MSDKSVEKKNSIELNKNAKHPVGKPTSNLDLQTFLPYRMYCLAAQMSHAGNDLSELLNITDIIIGEREWRVISILGAYGGLTNGHLANALKVDVATVSRAVKVLKKSNLIDTLSSKKDRRKVLIYLTELGAELYDKVTPKRIDTGQMIDSCFTHEELSTLHHLLNKLDRHLQHLENELEDEWE